MKITAALLILILFLPNAYPQDSTQLNLPEGAVARLGKGYVRQLLYSPDGARFAVLSSIGTWLYDTTSYREVALLPGYSAAFSPDGSTLATADRDYTVSLWDTVTGRRKQTLTEHTKGVAYLVFSPDGRTLASGSDDGTVLLWKVD